MSVGVAKPILDARDLLCLLHGPHRLVMILLDPPRPMPRRRSHGCLPCASAASGVVARVAAWSLPILRAVVAWSPGMTAT
jgi:hypothetical protein